MKTKRFEYEPPELWDVVEERPLVLAELEDSLDTDCPLMTFRNSRKLVIEDINRGVLGVPARVKRIIVELEVEDET